MAAKIIPSIRSSGSHGPGTRGKGGVKFFYKTKFFPFHFEIKTVTSSDNIFILTMDHKSSWENELTLTKALEIRKNIIKIY